MEYLWLQNVGKSSAQQQGGSRSGFGLIQPLLRGHTAGMIFGVLMASERSRTPLGVRPPAATPVLGRGWVHCLPWALAVLLWALSGRGLGSRAGALPLLLGAWPCLRGAFAPTFLVPQGLQCSFCVGVFLTQNRARRHFACRNSTHFCPAGPVKLQPLSRYVSPCARPAGYVWVSWCVTIRASNRPVLCRYHPCQ